MNILVTGGSGFIGSFLVQHLLDLGHSVRVLDNLSRNTHPFKEHSNLQVIRGDICCEDTTLGVCNGMEAVIHLAAINGTESFYKRPKEVFRTSVEGTLNIIKACEVLEITTLIYASSAEVYANPTIIPTPESYSPTINLGYSSRFSYGGGKLVGEMLMQYMARHSIDRPMIFRPHNVYGPRMGYDHVVPALITRIHGLLGQGMVQQTVNLPIQGTGEETRSFTYIDDAVTGIVKILENGKSNETYHIGSGIETSIRSLASTIGSSMGVKVKVIPGKLQLDSPVRRVPDISKIRTLGFNPKTDLLNGVKKTTNWYLNHSKE